MNIRSRGKKWGVLLVMAPLVAIIALAVTTSGFMLASAAGYGSGAADSYGGCGNCGMPIDGYRYGIENDMLFIANGRASNVAVLDVAKMSMVDYIPVPRSPINLLAPAGQTQGLLSKSIQGLGGLSTPVTVPDMFYWEVHGVVPSADRGSVYAIGALAGTDSDFTMYQVNTKTHNNDRKVPLAPSVVGYCGLEYDRNDESTGVLWAENMQTGPADLAYLFGSPLQLKDPVAGLLPSLGLGGLLNTVENQLSLGVGGISEENLASGTNTRYIATDYNADGASSSCGIAWDASGDRAFVSQMFEPLIDTINWNTKVVDGEIVPPSPGRPSTQHQSTSAKSRDLLFTANGVDGVAVYSMGLNTLVGRIDIDTMIGHGVAVHGVEVAPNNDNVLYVTGDGDPSATVVVDVTDIQAPTLIGGIQTGLDGSACGTYAINDKMNYYRASGRCDKPALNATKSGAYWASYEDYVARKLSVNFNIGVSGPTEAINVEITNTVNTNGVQTLSSVPVTVGDVSNTHAATVTLQYSVPAGVGAFRTSLGATAENPCGDVYAYPASGGVSVPPAPRA